MMPSWKISVASGEMLPARKPADVPEVAPRLGEGDEPAPMEHGGREDHVGRVRDAAARAVAVVVPVEIARPHRRRRILLEDGGHQVAEERDHRAAHHAPPPVEDAREVVLLLPDEGRHGRALDHRLHLGLRRPQRAPDDLARDRIAPATTRCRRAAVLARPRRSEPGRASLPARTGPPITRFPWRSTVARWPGRITVVASSCSTTAGPRASPPPAASRASWQGHSSQPRPGKVDGPTLDPRAPARRGAGGRGKAKRLTLPVAVTRKVTISTGASGSAYV